MDQIKLNIFPATIFPPLHICSSLVRVDEITIDVHEHYVKKSYRNRYDILGPNGVHTLSISLIKGKNAQLPMREVRIANHQNWQQRHYKSIKAAYGNAPYYDHFIDEIQPLFHTKFNFLVDFNITSLQSILKCLSLSNEINKTERYYTSEEIQHADIRNAFHSDRNQLSKSPGQQKYIQVFSDRFEFEPNLSILDLLFCKGPESLSYLTQI